MKTIKIKEEFSEEIVATLTRDPDVPIYDLRTRYGEKVTTVSVAKTAKGMWFTMSLIGLFSRKRYFVSNKRLICA